MAAIEIDAVSKVFQGEVRAVDGVTLTGLEPKEVQNESSRSPYAGLDLDR